MTVTCH